MKRAKITLEDIKMESTRTKATAKLTFPDQDYHKIWGEVNVSLSGNVGSKELMQNALTQFKDHIESLLEDLNRQIEKD